MYGTMSMLGANGTLGHNITLWKTIVSHHSCICQCNFLFFRGFCLVFLLPFAIIHSSASPLPAPIVPRKNTTTGCRRTRWFFVFTGKRNASCSAIILNEIVFSLSRNIDKYPKILAVHVDSLSRTAVLCSVVIEIMLFNFFHGVIAH